MTPLKKANKIKGEMRVLNRMNKNNFSLNFSFEDLLEEILDEELDLIESVFGEGRVQHYIAG